MTRLPPVPEEKMTAAQRAAKAVITSGKRREVRGPFDALLRSPELCSRAARLGEFLRFDTTLPPRLSELAILVTAAQWRAQFEWFVHAPIAIAGGLAPEAVEAIRLGVRPENLKADERTIYDFCSELHTVRRVSDKTYAAAVAVLGETGAVELTGICGYYVLIAMTLNVARMPLPAGERYPFAE